MSRSHLVDVEMIIVHETDRAVLVKRHEHSEPIWLPKSQIEIDDIETPGPCWIAMPTWLAEEKGLV